MSSREPGAPALPVEHARALVETAQRLFELKPWEVMSDLDLIGVRDESSGELRVLARIIEPVCNELGLTLQTARTLPNIEGALASLAAHLRAR